jgi:sporulation protein YlmC with PRC-barrel domain
MPDTSVPHDHIRATTVRGTPVYNAEGEHLGQIDDVVLRKGDGRATFAIMSFGGFLGIGEKVHPLPWQSLSYDPVLGGYVVSVTREQLEGAPSYDPSEEPDWDDPRYGESVGRYYGHPMI